MDFTKQWSNSDIVFLVENEQLHAHKCLLSLSSPVFDRMFNGDFKEKQQKEVHLPGKKCAEIHNMLRVMYDRNAPITDQNVRSLLTLADEYQIDQIKKSCQSILKQTQITWDNALPRLELASDFQLPWLRDKCLEQAKHLPSSILEQMKSFHDLRDNTKTLLLMNILKQKEKVVDEYQNASHKLINYLFERGHSAFMDMLTKKDLQYTSLAKCMNCSKYPQARPGQNFSVKCFQCRQNLRHVDQTVVKMSILLPEMEKLYEIESDTLSSTSYVRSSGVPAPFAEATVK